MGILQRAGDLVYTFRFLKLLVTPFEKTDAYERGIIDAKGKRIKSKDVISDEDKAAYTPFHRLVFNIKKLIPGGKLGSYASALYLLKESYIRDEDKISDALEKQGVNILQGIDEEACWFVVDDLKLAPGRYRLRNDKIINTSYEDIVKAKDAIMVKEDCFPVGEVLGFKIYEATHINSKQPVYVTVGELYK